MNSGMFGFPVGPTVTYRVEEFETSGTFVPSRNCQFVWVEMCGGGGGGQNGSAGGAAGFGGCAGLYWSGIIMASDLGTATTVTIGAGGVAATDGSATSLTNATTSVVLCEVNGGRTANNTNYSIIGPASVSNSFGSGGSPNGGGGRHGGYGPGGGGGGRNDSTSGTAGGRPCSMQITSLNPSTGGGAAGGTSSGNGSNASVTVRGFGEGAGGGGGRAGVAGTVGNGGNGTRGSGGGGGGASTTAGGTGGSGGSGFCRIVEVRFG